MKRWFFSVWIASEETDRTSGINLFEEIGYQIVSDGTSHFWEWMLGNTIRLACETWSRCVILSGFESWKISKKKYSLGGPFDPRDKRIRPNTFFFFFYKKQKPKTKDKTKTRKKLNKKKKKNPNQNNKTQKQKNKSKKTNKPKTVLFQLLHFFFFNWSQRKCIVVYLVDGGNIYSFIYKR